MEMQRWEESEKRREKKRREEADQRRERIRRKSRNTVFFQYFEAPEA